MSVIAGRRRPQSSRVPNDIRIAHLEGGSASLPPSALHGLARRLRGLVLTPDLDGYDSARKIWNARITHRPAVIVQCRGAADVVEALRFVEEHGLVFSVRGGGHSVAGTSLADQGVLIDLSTLKGVRCDPQSGRVWAQPGCSWGDVDPETQLFGRAVPGGIVSTTGIAGLTLGGGLGWLTRKYGYACDNVVSLDVVTAGAQLQRVSAESNPDLFWALRGGGGNFGIVTSFEYQSQPVGPTVLAGMAVYPLERGREVLARFQRLTDEAPDELTCLFFMRRAPALPAFPPELHGRHVGCVAVCYAGPPDEGRKHLAALDALGPPLLDTIRPKPFLEHQRMLDAGQPPGRHYYWKSEYLRALTAASYDTFIEHGLRIRSPHTAVLLFQLGGAMGRVGETDTAVGHRDARFVFNATASWEAPSEADGEVAWARAFGAAVKPFATGGVYVNYLTEEEGEARVHAAYGSRNLARLIALKQRFDPRNLFRVNQNVRPP